MLCGPCLETSNDFVFELALRVGLDGMEESAPLPPQGPRPWFPALHGAWCGQRGQIRLGAHPAVSQCWVAVAAPHGWQHGSKPGGRKPLGTLIREARASQHGSLNSLGDHLSEWSVGVRASGKGRHLAQHPQTLAGRQTIRRRGPSVVRSEHTAVWQEQAPQTSPCLAPSLVSTTPSIFCNYECLGPR